MTLFVRPIAVNLLCLMAVIGPAPAWLHMAVCDHEKHGIVTESSDPERGQHHHDCCHVSPQNADRHGEHDPSGEHDQPSGEPSHSNRNHDSDHCFLCQSLGAPNGVVWKLDLLSNVHLDVGIATIPVIAAPGSISLSIPQPRGPPAPLA